MTFQEFMKKNYPGFESAGKRNIEMWEEIWNGAIEEPVSLLNRWLDDPEESNIVSDTYHFICNNEDNNAKVSKEG